jgi:hypothetical protein
MKPKPESNNATSPSLIPHKHEPVAEEQFADLSAWIDARLEELELQFKEFTTVDSFRKSLREFR